MDVFAPANHSHLTDNAWWISNWFKHWFREFTDPTSSHQREVYYRHRAAGDYKILMSCAYGARRHSKIQWDGCDGWVRGLLMGVVIMDEIRDWHVLTTHRVLCRVSGFGNSRLLMRNPTRKPYNINMSHVCVGFDYDEFWRVLENVVIFSFSLVTFSCGANWANTKSNDDVVFIEILIDAFYLLQMYN